MRKATISFVMCVCPSVHPYARMEQLGTHWIHLLKFIINIFRNQVEKGQTSLKYDMYIGLHVKYLLWAPYMKTNIHF